MAGNKAPEAVAVRPLLPGLNRTVALLVLCQALAMIGTAALAVVAALAGQSLAEDKSLATLPISAMFTTTMLTTIPASLLMKRVGRRAGFTIGAAIGVCAGAVCFTGLTTGSFVTFTLGAALQGAYNAFWQYYRFAAVDSIDMAYRSRAISFVLAGGVIAAIVGPELAEATHDLFGQALYAGTYAAVGALAVAATLTLQMIDIPRPSEEERLAPGRPLGAIARDPTFVVAVLSAMIGYGAMVFIMTATPLGMQAHAHAFGDVAFVIQWHALAMFAPSFFTGRLIGRLGVVRIIMTGSLVMLAGVLVNLSGTGLPQFWAGLLLVGLGWNFMFVGGTTLVTETYQPSEKAKVQGLNDFLVFGTAAAGTLASGGMQHVFGWEVINLWAILPIGIAFAAAFWLRMHRRTQG